MRRSGSLDKIDIKIQNSLTIEKADQTGDKRGLASENIYQIKEINKNEEASFDQGSFLDNLDNEKVSEGRVVDVQEATNQTKRQIYILKLNNLRSHIIMCFVVWLVNIVINIRR